MTDRKRTLHAVRPAVMRCFYLFASCLGIAGPAMEHAFLLWAREHLQRSRPTGRELPEVMTRIAELEGAR